MIAGQAGALDETAGTDVSGAADRLRTASRIVLTGTGTSHHAAQLGAGMLIAGGVRARAVESVAFAGAAEPLEPDEAAIVITHTGETAFALRARARLLAAGAPFVTVTGPSVGWPEAIATPVKEESETYTVSYTAALGVLGLIAHALAGTPTGPEAIRRVAARVGRIAAAPEIDHVPIPARALAIVGAGPWAVTAHEGALKLREGARMLCEGFDAERLLHGAAVPYGPADGLVALAPDADPDGLVGAVAQAATDAGNPGSVVRDADPESDPYLAQLPLTVRLQCLAARWARWRHTDPDVAITGAWAEPKLWNVGAPEGD
jgi:glucosamine--fructose-6-phosphate aminotransferase (isomerizing)